MSCLDLEHCARNGGRMGRMRHGLAFGFARIQRPAAVPQEQPGRESVPGISWDRAEHTPNHESGIGLISNPFSGPKWQVGPWSRAFWLDLREKMGETGDLPVYRYVVSLRVQTTICGRSCLELDAPFRTLGAVVPSLRFRSVDFQLISMNSHGIPISTMRTGQMRGT